VWSPFVLHREDGVSDCLRVLGLQNKKTDYTVHEGWKGFVF